MRITTDLVLTREVTVSSGAIRIEGSGGAVVTAGTPAGLFAVEDGASLEVINLTVTNGTGRLGGLLSCGFVGVPHAQGHRSRQLCRSRKGRIGLRV